MTNLNDLLPAFKQNNVPVVFTVDAKYVAYFSVALQSVVDYASTAYNYDIIVLDTDIQDVDKQLLLSQIDGLRNVSLRFYNVSCLLNEYGVDSWWRRQSKMSVSVYSRLFVPEVFRHYDKVVYLDSDILARTNIASLYATDLGDNCLAAVLDYGDAHIAKGEVKNTVPPITITEYFRDTLHIRDVSKYFNSGVVVFNVKKMRADNMLEKFIRTAEINNNVAHDQNILNAACQDAVLLLDDTWNVQWHVTYWPHFTSRSERDVKEIIRAAKILHYNSKKPHRIPEHPLSPHWLVCARKSPYYERLIIEGGAFKAKQEFYARQRKRSFLGRLTLPFEKAYIRLICGKKKYIEYKASRERFFQATQSPSIKKYYKVTQ